MFRGAALCAAVFALALAGTAENSSATKSPAAGSAESRSVVGTIVKYDVASHSLSLSTATGEQRFVLAETTPVRLGSRVLKPQDLAAHKGARAKVRYTEEGGKRTVESVMVSAPAGAFAAGDLSLSGH
jgi:hypothetical protein